MLLGRMEIASQRYLALLMLPKVNHWKHLGDLLDLYNRSAEQTLELPGAATACTCARLVASPVRCTNIILFQAFHCINMHMMGPCPHAFCSQRPTEFFEALMSLFEQPEFRL